MRRTEKEGRESGARQLGSTLLGFAFLAGLVYAAVYLAGFGVRVFDGVDRRTAVLAGTASLTLLLAVWMVANGLHSIARSDETTQRRSARAAAYEAFLQLRAGSIEGVFAMRGNVIPVDESAADAPILLHGSPAVVGAYARLRRAEASGGEAHDEMVELIRAMRRDLGQRTPDAPLADLAEVLDSSARKRVG